MIGQINMFDLTMPMISIENKIRLIELFAGYGSQAMALDEIGADYEHWKISEWEVNVNRSYKVCHIADNKDYTVDMTRGEVVDRLFKLGISNDGKSPMTLKQIGRKPEKWQRRTLNEFIQCHNLGSITKVHGKDFAICDTDKYTYMFTYSFPCTDLSVAGKMLGMSEGSGTRSGLLWEVKRILTEIHESGGELPQILFMENVPQVLSAANIKDFHVWQDFLVSLGYTNHVQILNAKDYGVAQNRERAFMFSFLGEFNYKFPEPIPLTKTMKDYLEDEVDEKYYINTEKAQKLIEKLIESGDLQGCVGNINPSGNGLNGNVYAGNLAPTLTTNKGEGQKIYVEELNDVMQLGNIMPTKTRDNPNQGRVYDSNYISPSLNCMEGGGREPMIIELGRLNSSQDGIVVDSSGISKTITAGNNNQPKTIVAMRGRNPADGTAGVPIEQRLEPNSQGICNAITTVQKDNMVLERNILGGFNYKTSPDFQKGILPGMSRSILANNDGSACIEETVRIKQATKDGYIDCKIGGVADLSFPTSKTRRGRVQDNGDTCPTITAGDTEIYRIESIYRIRKLTERECGRLMCVSDENISKMKKVNSNSQLYKQFGNSIVVLCMVAMFSNLNIQGLPRWDEIKHKYF